MKAALEASVLRPDWPAFGNHRQKVQALMTLRESSAGLGASAGAFAALDGAAGFNLGLGSGEDRDVVAGNRARLGDALGLPLCWINQVHGTGVVEFKGEPTAAIPDADAAFTCVPGLALAVLVADCLPVLIADESARCVAVAHAGWRGLSGGVLEALVASLPQGLGRLHAWLGPAIGRDDFEVGDDVLQAFARSDPAAEQAFRPKQAGKWLGDLPWLARRRLAKLGLTAHGNADSTVADAKRFYSFRRDRVTGRMAGVIWIERS
jgi:YfiH family protein